MHTDTIVEEGIIPAADATDELSLPASYAIVPAVALNKSKTSVPVGPQVISHYRLTLHLKAGSGLNEMVSGSLDDHS